MAVTIDGSGEISGLDEINNIPLPTTGFGKVLQVVRATDTTNRSTTSTSFVDVTGMSVTITPQRSTSAILILSFFSGDISSATNDNLIANFRIADSSNNAISGAQNSEFGTQNITGTSTRVAIYSASLSAYSTPATTSAVTYKLQAKSFVSTTTVRIQNSTNATGQMYAIEVSA